MLINFVEEMEEAIRVMTTKMDEAGPLDLGLDIRAGYKFWVSEDGLITTVDSDRTLQYYGAFEYVEKQFRTVCGKYVIYTRGDEYVDEALDHYFDKIENLERMLDGEDD